MNDLIKYISEITNEIDNISVGLQSINYNAKELEYAIQKLKEAIFWLTFIEEDLEGEDNE